MKPASLVHLAVSKICELFDEGKPLASNLKPILPPPLFNIIVAKHQRYCIKVWLRYHFYCGKMYCGHCVRLQRPTSWKTYVFHCFQRYRQPLSELPITRCIGPIQISNWLKINDQFLCHSCKVEPYLQIYLHCSCVM